MDRYTGKVALVTGAARGIGAAAARRIVAEGGRVVLCARSEDEGQALASALGGPERALFVRADLTRPEQCAAVVDTTVTTFGRLDLLVNNAASVERGTLESTSVELFDRIYAINVRAPFLLAQRALPTFQAQYERDGAGGVIINIGSINAYVGLGNLLAYSTSKGALNTLSKNLADALGPWLIRVHVLNVGWTWTEGEERTQQGEGAPADWAEQGGKTRPWGRLITADEIAGAIAYLGSNEAAIFSGAVLDLEQFPMGRLGGHVGK